MAKKPTPEEADAFVRQFKWFVAAIIGLVVVPLIVYGIILNRRLTGFEESLKYRPPGADGTRIDENELAKLTSNPAQGGLVYVPCYSHIYGSNGKPHLLTITLSVRNTSVDQEIVVKSVKYYDTKGREVKSYLEHPLNLAPLETTEFFVEREDVTGGSGANFLVEWLSKQSVSQPAIEAVMADTERQQGIAFVRSGILIRDLSATAPKDAAAPKDASAPKNGTVSGSTPGSADEQK